ncbi:predicted hydrolase or acyltransferase [Pseudooceanicola batsensis HTCC2597]|uniref:Predicted hydrolase or acyltransferase n=1 Tax=Pseudooceanicola batsensis (strain ATCC BAA-863 / DSM 15984 / KCTC 12145 / HTCC2597) TaxID=252305 RepID=A3U2A5_PSEBH|nr:alpha/beta hydrolase [Pseudooceanicola batsensis]EAQ01705.1 predicted hydrolase or acyltransferase [Pseudooceanicola batsensis HTCC2597]
MPHFTAPDGTRLYYEDAGAGVPVLCLSGLTRNARDFDFVAPHLPDARLIRMDYRGRGLSDHTGPEDYAVPVEARDALALLDHLGVDRAGVLGTSRGGMVAMVMGATAKDRLLGVAFNDVGPAVEPGGLDAIMDYLGRVPPEPTLDAAAEARVGAPGFDGVGRERWRQFLSHILDETDTGLALKYDPRLREAVAAVMEKPAPDLWPLFDLLTGLPCAVIRGANSDLLSAATVREMARRHPGLIEAEVPDRGHIPFLDEPEAVDALTRWLEALR